MNAAKWMRWAIGCLLMVTIVGGVKAASEDKKITVPVEDKKDAGIGFNYLTEAKVFDLQVDLTSNTANIDSSKVTDIGGRAIWAPKRIEDNLKTHSYEAAGVKPNYGHAACFQGHLVKNIVVPVLEGCERTDDPDFRAHLSDLDLDIDSDNNSTATPRTPSRTDNEDLIEYVTGDVSPNNTLGLRAAANTVIAMKLHLVKRKEGTLTVTAPGVTFYSDAACTTAVTGWNANTAAGTTGLTAYMKVTADKDITATFTPDGGAGSNQGPGDDTTGKAEDKVKVLLGNDEVTFSPNPVVTGFKKKPDGSLDPKVIGTTVVATFSDPTLLDVVKIVVTDPQGRIETIDDGDLMVGDGTITFKVYGKTATDTSAPYGETTIKFTTSDDSPLSGEVQVIVVAPKKIGTPHPEYNGPAERTNICRNETTIPPVIGVLAGTFVRYTVYSTPQTIPVWDQFDNMLDSVYQTQPVEEYLGEKWYPINQSMSDTGTYTDPVGITVEKPPVLYDLPEKPGDQFLITDWPKQETPDMEKSITDTHTIPVKVAGHTMTGSDGIKNRKVTSIPPNTLKIEWP